MASPSSRLSRTEAPFRGNREEALNPAGNLLQTVSAPAAERLSPAAGVWHLLRPDQWGKNLLLIVPLGLGHHLADKVAISQAVLAAAIFCVASSAVYAWEEIAQGGNRKRSAGNAAVATILTIGAIAAASALSWTFAASAVLYMILNAAYSLRLKEVAVVDIIILASFYVIRVIAGGLAIGIWLSFWTLAFSLFLFFSLALLKRYSELQNGSSAAALAYTAADAPQINMLGVASSVVAVLIVGLYINGAEVRQLYSRPDVLWFICPILLAWCSRLWLLAGRGQLKADPVAFALKDRWSYLAGILSLLVVVLSL
jgi:4-hydroxybenzoate polyprenyltransferase